MGLYRLTSGYILHKTLFFSTFAILAVTATDLLPTEQSWQYF